MFRRSRFQGLWRHPDFLKLWTGQTISVFGSYISGFAIPIIAVITLNASPLTVALLSAVGMAPGFLLGLIAGVWVDRLRRRPILIATDLGRATILVTIPVAAAFDALTIPHLVIAAFATSVLSTFFDLAYRSYLPSLVRSDQLVEGNSKLQASASAGEVSGFALAGALIQLLTAPVATAAFLARRMPTARCFLLAKGDVGDDFRAAGVPLVGPDGEPEAEVVVIGGAEEELTYARLNHAYRLLLSEARLVAMHRNTAWRTAAGMSLDSGPFVLALERAAGVRATVIGKPALAFFGQGLRELGLPAAAVTMVGDDARNDLELAHRLGMRTVLVRTGKPVGSTEAAIADLVLDSVAALRAEARR